MEDCVFCKIVRGEIPSRKTYHENERVISFADIKPVRPGHTLLVPVDHYQWFWELPDDISNDLFKAARTHAKQLKEETGADYVQLSIVGRDVPHVHVHLIPRMFDDNEVLA